jgi:hypothetical protein
MKKIFIGSVLAVGFLIICFYANADFNLNLQGVINTTSNAPIYTQAKENTFNAKADYSYGANAFSGLGNIASTGTVSGNIVLENSRARVNVKSYGALGNGIHNLDAVFTSGHNYFTSASASFTSADIGKVITISNGVAAHQDLVTTITAVTSSTQVTIGASFTNSASGVRYTYGTDDTVAIQSAINAVAAMNGGTIYFPAGIYMVDGAYDATIKSQLTLPTLDWDLTGNQTQYAVSICFEGDQFPCADEKPMIPQGGSIIYGCNTSAANGSYAILAGYNASGSYYFTGVKCVLKNIRFRTVENPTYSAVNLFYCPMAEGYNVYIDSDTPIEGNYVQPTQTDSWGLRMPTGGNDSDNKWDTVFVLNFYNGIEATEHSISDHIHIFECINAFCPNSIGGHGIYAKSISAEDNLHAVDFTSGGGIVDIEYLDVEHNFPGWGTGYDINDPSNLGYGYIGFAFNSGNFSSIPPNLPIVNGGSHLSIFTFAASTETFAGNVGIDTNSPAQTLSVNGNFSVATGSSPNHCTCWKTGGVIGYCSTSPDSNGNCTCN